MIVKIENGRSDRRTHCVSASVVPDVDGPDDNEKDKFLIIYSFGEGACATYSLVPGDKIWYLNDNGHTIDKDFRMCG